MNIDLDFSLLIPEFIVIAAAMAVLMADAFTTDLDGEPDAGDPRGLTAWLSFGGCAAAIVWICVFLWDAGAQTSFNHALVVDRFALFFKVVVLLGAGLSVLLSDAWMTHQRLRSGASHALMLLATVGMMFMVSAGDLVTLFLGLEIMSIPIYCLAASLRWDDRSTEAGVKYLVLGSFGTAIFLFGLALMYAYVGIEAGPTLRIDLIREAILATPDAKPLYLVGGGLFVLVGLLFKMSAAPFHMWTPDVYEGAPTAITAYMSVAVKATAAAAVVRIFGGGVLEYLNLEGLVWGIAALTMIIGNVMALTQSNVKRMLAYSSIAHGGYILVGVLASSGDAEAGVLYYALAYTVGNMAAFSVLVFLSRRGHDVETFDQLRGLGTQYPLVGVVMTIAMLSLIGMPPFAGFFGKLTIFKAAVSEGYIGLTLLALITSAVSVAYYLRPLIAMFMRESLEAPRPADAFFGRLVLGMAVATAATVLLGVLPDQYLQWAADSILASAR